MKQLRMILKAQEVYFDLSTFIVHKYEDGMTNIGQQYGTHATPTMWASYGFAYLANAVPLGARMFVPVR